MSERNYIGFTLDCRKLANVLAQDPTCRRELIMGIRETDEKKCEPLTTALGAANLTPQEGVEDTFCTVFPATVQGKKAGEAGLFYRNDAKGSKRGSQDGPRIQMRLKKQPKKNEVQTTGAVLPQNMDPAVVAQFLALIQQAQAAAGAQQAQPQKTTEEVPELAPEWLPDLTM